MSDLGGYFAAAQDSGFAADPRFFAFADDEPEPAAAAAPPAEPAFKPRPYGDGTAAMPGAAILALLDAAALAAAGHAPTPAPRAAAAAEPAADPVALARTEAYAQGWADAQAAAAAEAAQNAAAHDAIRLGFARLDGTLAAQSAAWLAETVAALCEATLAPLALDREGLAARAVRAVEALAEAEGTLTIRMNPDDHALAAALLPADWICRADATLGRGVLAVSGPEGGLIDDPADWPHTIRAAIAGAYPALAGAAA